MSGHPIYDSFGRSSLSPLGEPMIWQGKLKHPLDLNISSDTVHHTHSRKPSASTKGSFGSVASRTLRVANENELPSRTTSLSTLHFLEDSIHLPPPKDASRHISHKSSVDADDQVPHAPGNALALGSVIGQLGDIDLNAGCGEASQPSISDSDLDYWQTAGHGHSFEIEEHETLSTKKLPPTAAREELFGRPSIVVTDTISHPIRRLISTIRHGHSKSKKSLSVRKERWCLDDFDEDEPAEVFRSQHSRPSGHKKSTSWASSGFVNAVKSATTNFGTLSASQSQRTRRCAPLRNSKRSSKLSQATNWESVNGNQEPVAIVDEAAWDRGVQRRRTLEELVSSEESYIADLKVLKNVYFTLLASAPNVSMRTSDQIFRNVEDILSLHEELLLNIRFVMPNSQLSSDTTRLLSKRQSKYPLFLGMESPQATSGRGSMDVIRRSVELSWFGRPRKGILISEPCEVSEIAKVFGRFMARFFVYEEYGAKYELMLRDLTSTSKTIPNWHAYERGIEALANSLATSNPRGEISRKGLTFEDLLIKPIQRICKYPLLFDDLYKCTPVIDGPESRAEVEKVLCRMRETTQEINKATNDPETQARIQRSWRLQDLLIIPDVPEAPPSLRLMGHANLCGVLFVAYQTVYGLRGYYMLSILFKSYLLLALPKPGARYEIVAIIGLGDVRVDKPDNGRGLQCHNALHAWKLIFESDQRLYELIFCACSLREEEQWKVSLRDYAAKETQRQMEDQSMSSPLYSVLCLSLRSLGNVFGLPGTLTRRISIQRTATVSPRTNVCQVIITNTTALKNPSDSNNTASASMGRSQSLLSTNRIPILAPKRADRLRMECGLADVWTRDLLPFPGMSANRSEHLIRTSANSVMRKLSIASLTSNFTKRSTSLATLADNSLSHIEVQTANNEVRNSSQGLRSHQSLASLASLKPQGEALGASPYIEPASRIAPEKDTNLIHENDRTSSHQQSLSPINVENKVKAHTNSAKTVKSKRSRPDMLLKAFTAEGIKGWFT